jgi:hypothetical protein
MRLVMQILKKDGASLWAASSPCVVLYQQAIATLGASKTVKARRITATQPQGGAGGFVLMR